MNGSELLSAKAGTGKPPPGMTVERWKKLGENTRRAERLTGVAPVSSEGWEIVAVILMDKIDRLHRTQPSGQEQT